MWRYIDGRREYVHEIRTKLSSERIINKRWNAQHIQKWLNRTDPLHSTSVISHYAANSHSGLAVTEDGELIFGRDEGLGLYITNDEDPDFWLYTRKFRFFYDLYLHFETSGFKIKECGLDESPFSSTIPASKHTSGDVVAEAPAEEMEYTANAYCEVGNDDVVRQRRPAVASAKHGRDRAAPLRGHRLGAGQAARLLKQRAAEERQKARDCTKARERSDKQWRMDELDSVDPLWKDGLEYFPEVYREEEALAHQRADDRRYYDYPSDWGHSYDYYDYDHPNSRMPVHLPTPPPVSLLEQVDAEEAGDGGVLAILGLYEYEEDPTPTPTPLQPVDAVQEHFSDNNEVDVEGSL